MAESDKTSTPPPLLLWPLLLGGVGFGAGFFGPIALNPEANQGPMVGLFITGPGGVIGGLLLGVFLQLLPLRPALRWQLLLGIGALYGLATLYFCLPEPRSRGSVIEAEIASCRPAADALPNAIAYWDKRTAAVTWSPPRPGWRDEAHAMTASDPGVVLTLRVLRENPLLEGRKPWNRGRITAEGWRAIGEERDYFARFAGGECAAYPTGTKATYYPTWVAAGDWPPRDLPNFLNLLVLGPVPARYASLVREAP